MIVLSRRKTHEEQMMRMLSFIERQKYINMTIRREEFIWNTRTPFENKHMKANVNAIAMVRYKCEEMVSSIHLRLKNNVISIITIIVKMRITDIE